MRFNLTTKIILITIFLVALSTSFLGWYFVKHESREIMNNVNSLGNTLARQVAVNSVWSVLASDSEGLRKIISDVMKNEKDVVYVRIKNTESLDVNIDHRRDRNVNIYNIPILVEKKSAPGESSALAENDKNMDKIGEVSLGFALDVVKRKTADVKMVSFAIVLAVIFPASLSIFLAVNYVVRRPLLPLLKGIEKIRTGDLSYQVKIKSRDEIGQLALSFNSMARELDQTHVSKEYLDNILYSMFNSLLVLNHQREITLVNAATVNLLGYNTQDLIGKSIENIFAGAPPARGTFKNIKNVETAFLTKNNSVKPVLFSVSLMKDKSGRPEGYVCVAQDISERKIAEEKMKMFTQELERSNAELEQFAYVASHDLREPLRMVASYVQLLQRRYQGKLDDDADVFIGFAVDGVSRMQSLIDALLMYSRVGRHREPMTAVNYETVLQRALSNLEVAIQETQAQITHDPLPTTIGDEILLVQLFQNLISNDIKFKGADAPRIHLTARDDGAQWLFSVKDNGIGFDLQYKDKIFVIFQRLHSREEYPGTGIGLAVCKKIVERHGGNIWVDSAVGRGATFYFTIPKKGGLI